MRNFVVFCSLTLGTLLLGCGQPAEQPPGPATGSPAVVSSASASPAPTEATPSGEASGHGKEQAEALLAEAKDGKLPYQETKKKENGPALLYLLETDQEASIHEGALKGLVETYTGNERYADKKNLVDERYIAAVDKFVSGEDKRKLHYAIRACKPILMAPEPNAEIVAKLIKIAKEHEEIGARHEAIDALYRFDGRAQDAAVMDAFLHALGDEPAVASLALFRLNSTSSSPTNREAIVAKVEGLMKHQDPGVRGRSLLVLERYTEKGAKAGLLDRIKPYLKDENPYVRSAAIKALANSRNQKAIVEIMTLADDKAKNTYDIRFQGLLGSARVHHDGSAWSRVDDSVLSALSSLTGSMKDKRFKKARYDSKKLDEEIAADIQRAKEWLEANKASL